LENGRVGSISKLYGKRDEVQLICNAKAFQLIMEFFRTVSSTRAKGVRT
jgi:hypothetical protein